MQLTISNIRLYETLKNKIGQQEAETFIQILESKVDEKINHSTSQIATKEDIERLERKFSNFSFGLRGWIVGTGISIVPILAAFIKFIH